MWKIFSSLAVLFFYRYLLAPLGGTSSALLVDAAQLQDNSTSSFMQTSPILPYFGGLEGEVCRKATVAVWEAQNTSYKQELDAVMTTDLYKTAKSYCQAEIDLYNRNSGAVCLLQEQNKDKYNLSYTEFWGKGDGVYFDGDYDLATLFSQTENFTKIGTLSTCLADCYTGIGDGCGSMKQWLPHYGEITVEEYCSFHWATIDYAYTSIQVCAAKAIGQPTTFTKEKMVEAFLEQQATEQMCTYQYCNPDVYESIIGTSCQSSSNTVSNRGVDWHGGVSQVSMGFLMCMTLISLLL